MKTFKILSLLLSYPTADSAADPDELGAILAGEGLLAGPRRQALIDFIKAGNDLDLLDRQERYVALFDRHRSLSLHLYEHVHGESRGRGEAMVRLAELYHLHGLEIAAQELPDYLPLFLEFLSLLPPTAARSVLGEAAHVVAALAERLEERRSPYAAVMRAVESLAAPADPAAVGEVLATLKPEADALDALDRQWEEEAVRFMGGGAAEAGNPALGAGCGR